MKLNSVSRFAALAMALVGFTGVALADSITFTNSVGLQPTNVGTITLTQDSATTVHILFDLSDTTTPAPYYGIINNADPHTPFAFNLSAAKEVGLSITFIKPSGGTFTAGSGHNAATYNFFLNTAGGNNNPYGSYDTAVDSNQSSGTNVAYFNDLEFTLTRAAGLSIHDFLPNSMGYYFSADLTNGSNTGAQAWKAPTPPPSVPDSGTSAILLGLGLISLALVRRKIA